MQILEQVQNESQSQEGGTAGITLLEEVDTGFAVFLPVHNDILHAGAQSDLQRLFALVAKFLRRQRLIVFLICSHGLDLHVRISMRIL